MTRRQEIAAIAAKLNGPPGALPVLTPSEGLTMLDEVRALLGALALAKPYVEDYIEIGDPDAPELLSNINILLGHPAQPSEKLTVADYEACLADHRRLVREIDVMMNGLGAAKQASLCDLFGDIQRLKNIELAALELMANSPIDDKDLPYISEVASTEFNRLRLALALHQ